MSLRILLLSFCTFLGSLAAANDDQYILKPTTAAPQARPLSGAHGYAYAGCWNETSGFDVSGGVRALGGGGEGVCHTHENVNGGEIEVILTDGFSLPTMA